MRYVDKIIGDPIAFAWAVLGLGYAGHTVYRTGEGWLWVGIWFFLLATVSAAQQRIEERRELPRLNWEKPHLIVRIVGHPFVAWLPLFLVGLVLSAEFYRTVRTPAFDGYFLIGFGILATPWLIVLRCTVARCQWKWSRIDETMAELTQAAKEAGRSVIPQAEIVAPKTALVLPGIPEAMRRLPPSLLELVQAGAQEARREMAE